MPVIVNKFSTTQGSIIELMRYPVKLLLLPTCQNVLSTFGKTNFSVFFETVYYVLNYVQ